jgi:uncharacterized membrane protein (DUF4010 family)
MWELPEMRLLVALTVGALVGTEREKRWAKEDAAGTAGVRTFALTGLLGGASALLFPPWGTLALLVFVGAMVVVGYLNDHSDDIGMTSEVALFGVAIVGALAMSHPRAAFALAVVMTSLLAFRDPLHQAVRSTLRQTELLDMLVFALAAVVIWPLLPEHPIDPWGVLEPSRVWRLVVFVMAIQGAGHLGRRLLGPRLGDVLAGFAGGFVSSSATIAAAVARSRQPDAPKSLPASATASSVATFVELAVLVWLADPPLLATLAPAFLAGGATVSLGVGLTLLGAGRGHPPEPADAHAFSIRGALLFAVLLTAVSLLVIALRHALGAGGVLVSVAIAGFGDAHAVSASMASVHAAGELSAHTAQLGILLAFSTNTLTKCGLAYGAGAGPFRSRVIPVHLLALVATWVTWAFYGSP